jgi:hypothetical protein
MSERRGIAVVKHFRVLVLTIPFVLVVSAGPARAQWGAEPAEPSWGDYDDAHVWRDASWWWTNRRDWIESHHPEWWATSTTLMYGIRLGGGGKPAPIGRAPIIRNGVVGGFGGSSSCDRGAGGAIQLLANARSERPSLHSERL